ncbi:gag-pol polyprotein, partial [Trifolium medium]|nr:gag-pol polyprotein [Trifolium medium]
REQRRKLDPKSEEGIFLGYSISSRAYRVYNSRTKVIMESINVVIDDSPSPNVADVEADAEASHQQSEEVASEKESEPNLEVTDPEPEPAPVSKAPSIR